MKRRLTVLMMAAALACGGLIACGTSGTEVVETEKTEQATLPEKNEGEAPASSAETVYGEVTAVSDDGFTMTVGTYADGELTLGDESVEITVTSDTKIQMSQASKQEGGAPSGEAPADMPEGEAPSGEAPAGEAPADMPEGEAPSGEAPADVPSGNSAGEAPENMPEDFTLESITEGTQVAVIYDADGNVMTVEIL